MQIAVIIEVINVVVPNMISFLLIIFNDETTSDGVFELQQCHAESKFSISLVFVEFEH